LIALSEHDALAQGFDSGVQIRVMPGPLRFLGLI
jgi:hypothetical protein